MHRYRRIVTSRVAGRQLSGSCASSRVTVSRILPAYPAASAPDLGAVIGVQDPGTPGPRDSGSRRWPTTTRPSSSRRQNVVRSGQPNVASGTSRSSRWAAQEPPSSEDFDTYPGTDFATALDQVAIPQGVPAAALSQLAWNVERLQAGAEIGERPSRHRRRRNRSSPQRAHRERQRP